MSPATILLVEDNFDNATIYRTILEHYGFETLVAGDGELGISIARERLPDLILMDISIPKIDGWQATKILKADPRTRHIPIVALTAHALSTDKKRAEDAGCDGYLAKPIEPQGVLAEVRRQLSAAAEGQVGEAGNRE